jgi:hypothetical protein
MHYPTNAHGHTYGSAAEASDPHLEPDLIAVMATNGVVGYARKVDLDGPLPASPAEAVASMPPASRTVPVFDQEETVQVGDFLISRGSGS